MKRYVIERDLPGIGGLNRAQLKDAAATSNGALAKLAGQGPVGAFIRRRQQDLLHLPRRERSTPSKNTPS